jgi:glycerol uptake facilitator-like aquaporin
MKLEREVIVDLLPAYFSGEASAATRALVEEYFREHPDFEQSARKAGNSLETLKVVPRPLDAEKEKLAFERARMVTEARSSFLWMAILFTVMLFLFRIHDHKIVWVFWGGKDSFPGIAFSAVAVFLWLMYFYTRKRKDPITYRAKFLGAAIFYSLFPFLFTIKDHKIVWVFNHDPNVAIILGGVALINWGLFFYHTWKSKRTGL